MEKRTIGSFIAALRRASGMTQKELAERLSVSDKTVSRWERDDGLPDLTLIPVIAEIFGVTADELLRGEKKTPGGEGDILSDRGQRQRSRILRATLSRSRGHMCISIAVTLVGGIASMVANFAFLRGYIGFFCAMLFSLAAVLCTVLFLGGDLMSLSEVDEDEDVHAARRCMIGQGELSIFVAVVSLGAALPMLLFVPDAYAGLTLDYWAVYGLLFGLSSAAVGAIGMYILHHGLLGRGVIVLPPREAEVHESNFRLYRIGAGILAAALVFTGIIHLIATAAGDPRAIMHREVFTDYDSFVAYMEQEIPRTGGYYPADAPIMMPDSAQYFDEYGNEITEIEARTRTVTDRDGNVVCSYIDRNENVCSIRWTAGEGTALPIYVSTYDDLRKAEATVAIRNGVFVGIYALEMGCAICICAWKRKTLRTRA